MQWILLLSLLPLIIVPVVLLFGFAGCGLDVVGTGLALPPKNLTATAGGTDKINLNWTPDPASTAPDFIIERSPPGGTFGRIPSGGFTTKATSFTDGGLSPGTTFIYRVKSTWTGGSESAPSNTATATTVSAGPPPPPPGGGGGGGGVLAVPVINTHDSGSGNETIITIASQLAVEVWGAGGSGRFGASVGRGGGGGAYSKKTLLGPFAAGSIAWSVGAGGGAQNNTRTDGNPGGSSKAGGAGQLVNVANVGGGAGGTANTGAGGAAGTGGDVNTPGGAAATENGGTAAGPGGGVGGAQAMVGGAPGGGGGSGSSNNGNASSGAGANGRVKFTWS